MKKLFFGLSLAVFMLVNYFAGASLSVEETKQNSKTIKLFIFQSPAVLTTGNSTTTQFSVFVGEKDPIIKDAYIEVRGIASSGSARNVIIDVNQSNSFPTSRQQSFVLGDNATGPNYFRLLYSGSATASTTQYFAGIITNPGNYNFYLKTGALNTNISAIQARLVLTYVFTPPSAGTGLFPAVGYLESPVFDTGAANGVTYNWIMWKGSKPIGTKVKFQIATSENSAGPWNYIGSANCDTGYYEPDNNVQQEIKCYVNHNNKRYFRYKITLCSIDSC
ncbi:MAG: hypothetical protein AAB504_00385, partial [Patescibacteria group bacterium]